MLPDTFNLADYATAELKHIYEYLKNAFEGQDINLERELIEHYPNYLGSPKDENMLAWQRFLASSITRSLLTG